MQSEELRYLTVEEVYELHRIAIERFGGSAGVRDPGMVESAVLAPQQTWEGERLLKRIPDIAAAYWFGLAKNHGFVDGNKRVALMAADAFLQLNGLLLTFPEDDAERVTLDVATGDCSHEELAKVIAASCRPLD